jgi:phospholipid/cholesterol/gamma-HCH transport system substrate-binding protein
MKESNRNFVTGIMALVALTGFATLLLLFGELDRFFRPTWRLEVVCNDTGGLRPGSQAMLNGVPVGSVDSVRVEPAAMPPVRVLVRITDGIDLPVGCSAQTHQPLVGGGSRLNISLPPGYRPGGPVMPKDGTARIEARFEGLEGRFARILDNLNTFFAPVDEGAPGSEESVRTAVRRLNALLDTAQGAFADAREWLGDEQLQADARSAVWKAGTLIDAATSAMNSVSESAQGIRVDARTLVASAQPALDEMTRTLQAVQRLADQAGSGEGTVGQLMSNPDLYNALTDSAVRLKAALAEIELLLRKVRDEGLDVKF